MTGPRAVCTTGHVPVAAALAGAGGGVAVSSFEALHPNDHAHTDADASRSSPVAFLVINRATATEMPHARIEKRTLCREWNTQ